ncbi:nicotinic acid mononucleotide adenyltransferase [Euzebyella marina]|uniref:Nicotinic acid mononucleotide adenyltransferase n=2 Tax=Euzebyella marina TaxID=1761453 RepID=A0A3G2L1X8_9FLAO|nr:nicotinic acid mononucleotide adenyltransferase [Euzebyella marina]AYN66259.1 nicotinic acid mononucleotide adenyltransferase [Euzebyella marina]MBG50161.1 nicotinic acid mononucleotide adenyltransferase [Pseudozobellia sp.]|tara:strand:- start:248 stop:607 length:360 start_codon:yes stop_codon:yes gene_type:complete
MKNIMLLAVLALTFNLGYGQKEKEVKLNKETNLIEATYFHDNGAISQQGTFDLDGKLHGDWLKYNEQGDLISEGTYTKGVRTGKWKFISDGVVKEVEFDNNVIASVTDKGNKSSLVSKD